jgi:hypothetical protein
VFDFFRPLLTSQGGGQVIGIADRLRAERSVVRISVGQETSYPKRPDRLGGLFSSLFIGYRGDRTMRLTTHSRLVPRLRMSGAVSLLSLHDFMAWTGKTWFCLRLIEAGIW